MAQELVQSVFENCAIFNSDNSHASFGKLLSDLHHEQVYLQAVLDSNTTNNLITEWLNCYENRTFLPSIQHLFTSGILSLPNTYFKPRFLIDDGSILDTQNSLIHTILSSNENINVVIVDDGIAAIKRDVGLYSLEYGNAYVASICPLYSYSKAVQALKEANDFIGPSIVILYSPKLESQNKLKAIQLAKENIESGLISLYRYTPTTGKLDVDSTKPKATLEKFLKKQSDLSLMFEHQKQNDVQLVENIDKLVLQKAKDSYQKLFGQLNRKKLLILYGSDGSNAKSLAKRIGLEAKEKGLLAKVLAMDEFNVDDLINENLILFVVSTAGQGEFPSNARETWKFLQKTDLGFAQTNYSVFALGDRHYWPREEDKHFFCKAGKDLDLRLKKLGAKQLTAIGLGDDRDPDGYFTAFADWAPLFWESIGVDSGAVATADAIPTDDAIKSASNYLRGTIAEGLLDESTGQLYEWDTKLTKFHGIYQQDDRDIREHRARKGMEKAFSFMIRVRVPGGVATAAQYLAMDEISDKWANSTIKLTTRQAFQFHGVLKSVLKKTIQDINHSLLDTIAACGDVNRNVMCNPNPGNSKIHEIVLDFTKKLSTHLTPATGAYHEIWLDKKLVAGGDHEPLYGKTYLPRKFKIAVAVPPSNDVDVLAHCLGYIAIVENGEFVGFNVTVGGGMGQTHGNKKTYPVLAKPLGFVRLEDAILVGEKVMLIQRDFGERLERKHARLKYTVEDKGIDWFRKEVETRMGKPLQESKPYKFTSNGDRYGWISNSDGSWSYTLFIQNGRIKDTKDYLLKTGIREIAKIHKGDFALTPNQHLIIRNIEVTEKSLIESILSKYKISNDGLSGIRLNSMACVALPTCALAMAESERYLPSLITSIESILEQNGLRDDAITIRMTGCPNGCARPSIAEIAFIGKAPGTYNMYLGGGFNGERLNVLYRESVDEEEILKLLNRLFSDYAKERLNDEHFGDFIIRKKVVV